MVDRVSGKVAIVTGAAGRLGSEGSRLLAKEGAGVVMNDISPAVEDVAAAIRADGGDVVAHVGDVSREEDVAAMTALAVDRYGRLDGLWNNAGPVSTNLLIKDTDILDMTLDFFLESFRGHVGAAFLCSQYAIREMVKTGGGSIVNTSSAQASGGDMILGAYSVAKAAMATLGQHIATAFGHLNIRCNTVGPGLVLVGSDQDVLASELQKIVRQSQSLPRNGEPIDIANTVLYLLSDESRFLTGQTIYVDGGLTGHIATLATRRSLQLSGLQNTKS